MADDQSPEEPATPKAAAGGQSKAMMQINKLKEANKKYKNLLNLAKERITKQDEELEAVKGTRLRRETTAV